MSGRSDPMPVPVRADAATSARHIGEAWGRELPGVPVDSIEVITPLWMVAKRLADERRRTLSRLGVDTATLDLLSTLRRAGPPYRLTTRDLTARCLVTAGAISQRVARAQEAGLVDRTPLPAPSRTVVVALSETGHQLIEPVVRGLLEHETTLVATLTAADRRELGRILDKLVAALG